jgi:hypothetical protein
MTRIGRGWPARLIALGATVALAACQSAPQPSGSAATAPAATTTATVAPTATAQPVDVVRLFTEKSKDFDNGVVSFSGTATVGLVQVKLNGSSTYSGPDSSTLTTTTVGGVESQVETVQVAGKRYLKSGAGPWLEVPITTTSGDFTSQVGTAAKGSLRDEGTEQRQGQTVHRLVPTSSAGFDPSALLSSVKGATDTKVDLAFYVAEDGTPVAAKVEATWTQKAGEQSLNGSLSFDLLFSHVGQSQTVRIPTDVWLAYSSTRYHFAMARPAEWTFFKAKDADEFDAPYYAYTLVSRHKTQGLTLNTLAKYEVSAMKAFVGGKAVANEAATLSGTTARFLTASGKSKELGKTVQVYEAIAVKNDFVYYVLWVSEVGHAADDLALFQEMLGTFSYS